MKKPKSLLPEEVSLRTNKTNIKSANPVFSFAYLQDASLKKCGNVEILKNLLIQLRKISSLNWGVLDQTQRHGLGYETIDQKAIKPAIPDEAAGTRLLAFRGAGMLPFVGYRNEEVFYILFIETKFGDIYNHGK